MTQVQKIDRLIQRVHTLDRRGCIAHLRRLARPKVDFTDEFLTRISLDRLRHIVVAGLLQERKAHRP